MSSFTTSLWKYGRPYLNFSTNKQVCGDHNVEHYRGSSVKRLSFSWAPSTFCPLLDCFHGYSLESSLVTYCRRSSQGSSAMIMIIFWWGNNYIQVRKVQLQGWRVQGTSTYWYPICTPVRMHVGYTRNKGTSPLTSQTARAAFYTALLHKYMK